MLYGLSRRFVSRWLPFVLRLLFAASLWLAIAPLCTAYLYQAWIHKPAFVFERMQWNLLLTDLVSGIVVMACVILSFLSLISFADFLREEWQQNGLVQGGERRRHAHDRPVEDEPRRFPARDQDVDNGLWQTVQQEILAQPAPLRAGLAGMNENDDAMHLGQNEDNNANADGEANSDNGNSGEEDDENSDSSYDDEQLDEIQDGEEEDEEWMLDPIDQDEMMVNEAEQLRNVRQAAFPQNDAPPFVDDPDDPGNYICRFEFSPHFQFDNVQAAMSLQTVLKKESKH